MNIIRLLAMYIVATNFINLPIEGGRRLILLDLITFGLVLCVTQFNKTENTNKKTLKIIDGIKDDSNNLYYYEREVSPSGMVYGSWSIGETSQAYECSGIAGATDC